VAARLSPVAVRAWARPVGWKPTRRRRRPGSWPRAAFLLATVARPVPGEPLRFGACALLPSQLPGQRPLDVHLFYPDDCPPAERALLAEVAAARGSPPPLSQRELAKLFFRRCYRQRLPLVAFGLPPQLGRLAAGWRAARGGGFSLIFGTRPCPPGRRTPAERRRRPLLPNGEIEDGDRPRVTVRPLDGQRAETRFGGRGRPDPQDRAPDGEAGRPRGGYVYPGHFVDLSTVATVQASGERYPTVAAAAEAFEVRTGDHGAAAGDKADSDLAAGVLAELDDLAALYLRLLDCHQRTPGGDRISLDQVYSAASYADALLEAVGLELPLARCDLPEYGHAYGMGAFFGGDCGVAVRHLDVPVAYLDVTGHYPVSAHLAGAFGSLRATRLELVAEDPAELQRFLAGLTVKRLLANPTLWRRLGRTVCLVEPNEDLLPHRVGHRNRLLLKTAPLRSREPLPYMLADLAGSLLRAGPPPRIVSAFSIRPVPRHRKKLRPLVLPSGHVFYPSREDLFLALAEERLCLKRLPSPSGAEHERQAKLVKLIVNAACYGLLCQINVQPVSADVELVGLDGTVQTIGVDAVEEPGRWSMPLVAAGVTATGRLLLQLARTLVEKTGGTVCSWDTDSLCVAATPDGGLIPCPGGPYRDGRGQEAILALSFAQLANVQDELEQLSPYNSGLRPDPAAPLLLALEPENFDPDSGGRLELHLHATAAKNYDLYTLSSGSQPTITLRKWSEHGLGHLRTPGQPDADDRDWIEQGRLHLLSQRLGIRSQQPDGSDEPSISVITLNRPGELARLQTTLAAPRPRTLLRPFSRLAVAHANPLYARSRDGRRRTPVAPFHDSFDPRRAGWRDLTTGQPLTPRFSARGQLTEVDLTTAAIDRVLCDTVGVALERNSRRPEAKAVDADGHPCAPNTSGLLHPAPTKAIRLLPIGKETRNLERAGITEDPAHTLYTNPEQDAWRHTFLPALRALAPGLLPRGRPSRHQRTELARSAGQLARAALREVDLVIIGPDDPEQACYLYLETATRSSPRACACGCGQPVSGRAQYVSGAHRTRAYRTRRFARPAE